MSISVIGQEGLSSSAQYIGFKNRIINGDMRIDQRNGGAAITPSAENAFSADRWRCAQSVASKLTYQQVADAPAGFKYSLKATVAAQYTPSGSDYFVIQQHIETQNIYDFGLGTSNAQPFTLSFWVKASVAGTYSLMVGNWEGVGRRYVVNFPATTSWSFVSIPVPGDVTGSWNTSPIGIGLCVEFSLGNGPSNQTSTLNNWQSASGTAVIASTTSLNFVAQSTGSTFQVTGVQVEKGSVATAFDYRPYTTELQLCQRYCVELSGGARGGNYISAVGSMARSASTGQVDVPLPVTMRTAATSLTITPSQWQAVYNGSSSVTLSTATINTAVSTANKAQINFSIASSVLTAGQLVFIETINSPSATLIISAEL